MKKHRGLVIAAVSAAVVLVGGILILTLAGHGGTASAGAAAPTTTSTTLAPTPPAAKPHAHQGVRGRLTAINATTWTVTSAKGAAVTVDVTAATQFGTKAAPLTASNFAVGDQIVVVGTRTHATVTAARIAKAVTDATGAAGAGATTTPTTSPPTSTP